MKRVNLGMSGGVDSSVAAYLLQQKGYEVHGVTMLLCGDGSSNVASAKSVCDKLGIEHSVLDLRDEFRASVMENFAAAYEAGTTPNPCVVCNREIKFKYLFAEDALIATGHYAHIGETKDGRKYIQKADNLDKDQSYFLYSLSQEVLERAVFPLADYSKDEIREIASDIGLSNANRKDSQDVCFIPGGDYAGFIENFRDTDYPEGNFVDMDGNVLGRHKGIINYTIGQRKGLGLALKQPMYVYKLDVDANEVILCCSDELMSSELIAGGFNWMAMTPQEEPFKAKARIRYRHKEADCTVFPLDSGRVKIIFREPQRAITAGQSVVIYDDDIVIGGGVIL